MTIPGRGATTTSDRQPSWTRWVQRRGKNGSDIRSALDDSTYLSKWAVLRPTIYQLSRLEEVEAASCVVLLGESGLGKSHVMREWGDLAQTSDPNSVITSKLSLLSSVAEFGNDLRGKLGRAGSSPVIFVDGLEEAAYADKICDALSELFKGQSPPRLRLAVRSAAWRTDFESALASIWTDGLEIVELCPLLRSDVAAALQGVPDSPPIDKLESAGAAPLLARPVTLLMILKLIRTGGLPTPLTRRSIYQSGMRKLVERNNHHAHVGSREFPIDERLAAGRRLAAVTVFCARPLLRLSCDEAEQVDRLHIDQLVDSTGEPKDDTESRTGPISVALLDHVCRETGLFRSETDAVTWAHTSFAEFLAAEYVRLHKVPLAQLRPVLGLSSGEPVPLQLEGVLGWLAGGFPDLREELLRQRTESMLQTGDLTAEECERMVDHFLQQIADRQTEHLSFDVQRRARSLRHPGIAAQLHRWLASRDHPQVIYGVMDLVRAIGVRELIGELMALVLDSAQPERVRHLAALCVWDHGCPEEQARLAPLLESSSADPNDNLRGCALSALWPKQLTPEQLFAALTPPKRQNFTGSYQLFIHQLIDEVTAEQLPVALAWARQQPPAAANLWPVDLVAAIVELALQQPDVGSMVEPVLDILVAYYGAFHSLTTLIPTPLPATVRRALVEAQVSRLSAPGRTQCPGCADERILTDAGFIASGLVNADEDLPWLIEHARRAGSPTSWWLPALQAAVRGQAIPIPDDVFNGLYLLCLEQPPLRANGGCFAEFFAVALTPDRQRAEQAGVEIRRQSANADQLRSDEFARLRQSRLATIDAFARGDEPEPTFIRAAMPLCMGSVEEWTNAAVPPRTDLSNRALAWLRQACARERSPSAGANPEDLAWCLAVVAAADRIDEVDPETWCGLLTATDEPLSWLRGWQQPDEEVSDQVLRHGAAALTAWIQANPSDAQMDLLLTLLPSDRAWPATVLQAFLGFVRTKPDSLQLPRLEALPLVHFADAARLLQALAAPPSESEIRLRAQILMLRSDHEDSKSWVIQRLFQEPGNPEGRALAERVTAGRGAIVPSGLAIKPLLSPTLAAAAYPWLLREYPPAEDPSTESHEYGPRYHAGHFRGIVEVCLRVGNPAEVTAALEHVLAVIGEDAYLQRHLRRARREQATWAWRAPAPAAWLALMRDRERRWISNQEDLAAVVRESVRRFAGYLQGENAEVESLWNNSDPRDGRDGLQTPKREEALSNALARHLRRDLQDRKVIIHREVEVRPGKNSQMGRKTDVYVDAVSQTEQKLQLIIEVKRCSGKNWNDVQGELVDRYLSSIPCAGVFVVGRYDCGCSVCSRHSLPAMEAELLEAVQQIPAHQIHPIVLDCSWEIPGGEADTISRGW